MRIAICDELSSDCEDLCKIITKLMPTATVDLYSDGRKFLTEFEPQIYNIVFIDINFDNVSGTVIAERIRAIDGKVKILITSMPIDYPQPILDVAYYLEKPFQEGEISEIFNSAVEEINFIPHISLEIEREIVSIPLDNILYIKARGFKRIIMKSFIIITSIGETFDCDSSSISQIKGKLPANFIQCNRNCIVNLKRVSFVDETRRCFIMGDGVSIKMRNLAECLILYKRWLLYEAREELL